jgi:hypothetical protein
MSISQGWRSNFRVPSSLHREALKNERTCTSDCAYDDENDDGFLKSERPMEILTHEMATMTNSEWMYSSLARVENFSLSCMMTMR